MKTGHMTSDQISAWIAGDRREELAGHLGHCAECSAQVTAFEAVTGALRSGVHELAASSRVPDFRPRRAPVFAVRWALAGALAAVLIAIPVYQKQHKRGRAAGVEISDAALLQQVDAQLSRGVPGSMEPLTALVWSPQELDGSVATPQLILTREAPENR